MVLAGSLPPAQTQHGRRRSSRNMPSLAGYIAQAHLFNDAGVRYSSGRLTDTRDIVLIRVRHGARSGIACIDHRRTEEDAACPAAGRGTKPRPGAMGMR